MPTDVVMPQMGESITEGTITKWLKKVGDTIERDEPLFEISTDKVDAEIPSPAAGTLTEIKFPEGATVGVHTVVAVIGGAAGEPAAAPALAEPAPAPAIPAPVAPVMPAAASCCTRRNTASVLASSANTLSCRTPTSPSTSRSPTPASPTTAR